MRISLEHALFFAPSSCFYTNTIKILAVIKVATGCLSMSKESKHTLHHHKTCTQTGSPPQTPKGEYYNSPYPKRLILLLVRLNFIWIVSTNYDVTRVERKTAEYVVISSFVMKTAQNREKSTNGHYFSNMLYAVKLL